MKYYLTVRRGVLFPIMPIPPLPKAKPPPPSFLYAYL